MAGIAKEAADKSRASMNVIKQNIETGTYANVYLLFGDEVYLLDQYKKKLVDALMDGADAMNLTKVADKEFRLPEIIDIEGYLNPVEMPLRSIWREYRNLP